MDRKRRFGIVLIVAAVFVAGLYIRENTKRPEIETEAILETTHREVTTPEETIPEATTQEVTTEIITETETMDIYRDEHSHIEPMEVRYPDEEVLNLVNNDKDGLNTEVQVFVNGYGYGDAKYAEYAGDVQINSNNKTVRLTYYLKFKRKKGIYFYLEYNKKTKQWSSIIA